MLMIKPEDLADAALNHDALRLNSSVQDLWYSQVPLSQLSKPGDVSVSILVMSAGLLELLAQQWEQQQPVWTQCVGAMPQPFFYRSTLRKCQICGGSANCIRQSH